MTLTRGGRTVKIGTPWVGGRTVRLWSPDGDGSQDKTLCFCFSFFFSPFNFLLRKRTLRAPALHHLLHFSYEGGAVSALEGVFPALAA